MLLPKKSKKSKKEQNFYCACCHFSTSKKSNYDRHLATQKHLKKSLPIITKSLPKKSKKEPKSVKIFVCENCNKEYKSYKGLWGHKKKCMQTLHFAILEPSFTQCIPVCRRMLKLCSKIQAQSS